MVYGKVDFDSYIMREQDLGPECPHMVAIDDPKGIKLADSVCLIDCCLCEEQCHRDAFEPDQTETQDDRDYRLGEGKYAW